MQPGPEVPKHRKRYSPEFKAEAVRPMQTSDKPVAEIPGRPIPPGAPMSVLAPATPFG